MSEIYDRAIDKLRDEMAEKHDNYLITTIGEKMTVRLQEDPGIAELILAEGKTLKGAAKALEDYARSLPRAGKCVAVSDADGFARVFAYYGIDGEEKRHGKATKTSLGAALDIDALLGL